MRIFLLLAALAWPRPVEAAGLKLAAYDWKGRSLDAAALRDFIGRVDKKGSAPEESGAIVLSAPDSLSGFIKPQLGQEGKTLTLGWKGPPKVQLSLPWPIEEDGFSTVWADKGGAGYEDGDSLLLNEEIAATQYRLFMESWKKRTKDWAPTYKPGSKAEKLAEKARELMKEAAAESDSNPAERAAAFDKALHAVSTAWQKMLFEHGLQIAHDEKLKASLRFGLTLDDSFDRNIDNYKWVIDKIADSGANWVRLVFRSNPQDFVYADERSFTLYDAIVSELKAKNIYVMGSVLDTAQWPKDLTPQLYSLRTKNLVLRYASKIRSWEVGPEINGDWLGGPRTPLGLKKTLKIYSAAAAQVKSIEPTLETVATLYWWDGTAPDEDHSLFGWLRRHAPSGFADNLDVVALSLQPEDNPVGMAFERIFERLHEALPKQRLMLGSFGFVEKTDLSGYWWLDGADVDGARKDLVILYTAASCAAKKSLCGGFWWQTLDQMLLPHRKASDLFSIYRKSLEQLGR